MPCEKVPFGHVRTAKRPCSLIRAFVVHLQAELLSIEEYINVDGDLVFYVSFNII